MTTSSNFQDAGQCVASPNRISREIRPFSPPERYYQYVKYLALEPTPIPQQNIFHVFTFNMPKEECEKISKDGNADQTPSQANFYFNASLHVRLRVCLKEKVAPFSEEDWVLADGYWPQHIQIHINHQLRATKQKQHHGKHQPIEIGQLVRPGGNFLPILVPVHETFDKDAIPYVAVEVLETLSHNSIQALPNFDANSVTSPGQTQAIIDQRLGSLCNPDDEIMIVTSYLTINLADPFSLALWETPVRGKNCIHLECFDLETWLKTRPRKRPCTCGATKVSECNLCIGEPSLVDKWRCLLCRGDARPHKLYIDGFFVEVRKSLVERGLLHANDIKVRAKGIWTSSPARDPSSLHPQMAEETLSSSWSD
ncbi:hypothetical protein BKA67DRAFT_678784 [Truncatella angustata]|uniref:SP-RING-type domain-containing protein n=1 Tax=Truncatella angustata TaxID=152316 RepID=A0A9P8UJZ8_9PEZI|nr:uncharacterized protein BKA67DRAFT_678784 [Truncatella angustata]KAH6653390.1 hypothetical protein BKA67DRAFT_678784 [Truncatella angustata]